MFHCAHDLGIKTAAMLHFVASSPGFTLANDATYYGLESDILTEPHRIERGFMAVPEGPGLGAISRVRCSPDMTNLPNASKLASCEETIPPLISEAQAARYS